MTEWTLARLAAEAGLAFLAKRWNSLAPMSSVSCKFNHYAMSRKAAFLLVAGLIACLVGGAFALIAYWQRPQPVDAPAIAKAVSDFCKAQRANNAALPPSITLQELVKAGYLRKEAIRGFGDTEVRISLQIDENNPEAVLMEARLPDGSQVNALGDGSVLTPWDGSTNAASRRP